MGNLPAAKTYPPHTVAILNDGNTAIVVDDGCYAIRNSNGEDWGWSAWIFPEALAALKRLPDIPGEAEKVPTIDMGGA
jgi:hypothetical protein